MTIQTRNKRKDWQVGLGIKAHNVVCKRSLSGLSETIKWALRDQVSGIERTSNGHSLPVLQVSSAQSVGRFLGTSCESAASLLCMMLYEDFVMLLCWFGDTTMPILWYFYHIYDTSMILFCKTIRKVSFLYIIMYQAITPVFNQKDDTLRLFSRKNFFSCAYKLDGKSKKYLIWNLIDSPKITPRRRLYYMAT